MNNENENQNENSKGIKKSPEVESYEDDENEAMEDFEEDFMESTFGEDNVPPVAFQVAPDASITETEPSDEEKCPIDSYERKKQQLLREKWLRVTGRKPLNIPVVKKYLQDQVKEEKITFFGDNRPAEIEEKRKEKWLKLMMEQKRRPTAFNIGRIRKEIRLSQNSEGIMAIKYDPRGTSIATSCKNGSTQVRNPETGDAILYIKTLEVNERLAVRGICFHTRIPDKLYLGGGTGLVQVYDTATTEFGGASTSFVTQINVLEMSPDGSVLAAGGKGGKVFLIDPYTLQVISVRERPNFEETTTSSIDDNYHTLRVYALKFHPLDSSLFVTGGWDRTLKIWDVRKPEAILSIRGPFLCGEGLDFQGNSNTIISASWAVDDSLKFWDFTSGRLLKKITIKPGSKKFNGEFLYTARFFKNSFDPTMEMVAVGGSGFDEVLVIDVVSEGVIASFPTYKGVLTLDIYKNSVAYAGKESLFRIGDILPPEKLKKK